MNRDPTWLRCDPAAGRVTVTLYVQPGAKKSGIAGLHGDALKVRIAAPATDNKANAELVKFLGAQLGISRSTIAIRRGATGRRKVIEIAGGAGLAAKLRVIADTSTVHDPRSTPTSE